MSPYFKASPDAPDEETEQQADENGMGGAMLFKRSPKKSSKKRSKSPRKGSRERNQRTTGERYIYRMKPPTKSGGSKSRDSKGVERMGQSMSSMQVESFNGTAYTEANTTFGGAARKASAPTRPFGNKMRLTAAGKRFPGSTKNNNHPNGSLEDENRTSYGDRRKDSHGRSSKNDVVFISDLGEEEDSKSEEDSMEEKDAEHDLEDDLNTGRKSRRRKIVARRESGASLTPEDAQRRRERDIRIQDQLKKLKHFKKIAREGKLYEDEKRIREHIRYVKRERKLLPEWMLRELAALELFTSPYHESQLQMIRDEIERMRRREAMLREENALRAAGRRMRNA